MAGTVVVDAVKSSTTGAPTFQNTSGTEIGQLCRAWVNFNGTGTVAIRASFNVSSITDLGTGQYRVNFANPMPDANYAAFASAGADGAGSAIIYNTFYNEAHTSAGFRFITTQLNGADTDYTNVMVSVFR